MNVLAKIMGLQGRNIDIQDYNTKIFEAFQEVQKELERLGGAAGVGSKHYSRAYNSNPIAIVTATPTPIPFDSITYQNVSMHSVAVNNTRMTALRDGFYTIHASVQWEAIALGIRSVGIQINGSTMIASLDHQAALVVPAFTQDQSISSGFFLREGEYFEVIVYQNSGGPVNINVVPSSSPEVVVLEH
jgi:hypothetical protein